MAAGRFADWRLQVGGLVTRPAAVADLDLGAMPQRAQITRHDCVEGWSAIGKWQGPMLGNMLKAAGVRDAARYIVFPCADLFGGHDLITNRSTWSTPSTRRRSSPGR